METGAQVYHGQQERLRVLHGERLVFEFLAVDRFPPSACLDNESCNIQIALWDAPLPAVKSPP
jgi:hypothetical protein